MLRRECFATTLRPPGERLSRAQVVGAFLESGSGEENAAIKKVADLRPDAPSNLEAEGLAFASKL